MLLQPIVNIAEIACQKGINHVVISPGSRSALITLAFARHREVKSYVIKDERSAGFFALGMAQALKKPVIVICTSGTAVLNLYPAVAEAYFQQIPLIIISADRPAEWIEQNDGQTLFQNNVFNKHVKRSFNFPDSIDNDDVIWHGNRIMNEAINLSMLESKGPVHINIPIREPFYPDKDFEFKYDKQVRIIHNHAIYRHQDEQSWNRLNGQWKSARRVLMVIGQSSLDDDSARSIKEFAIYHHVPVVGDIISNLQKIEGNIISFHDLFLGNTKKQKKLSPDLLITIGQSVLSKNLKKFLRENKPDHHWHIQEAGYFPDPFMSLTETIRSNPEVFFKEGKMKLLPNNAKSAFLEDWEKEDSLTNENLKKILPKTEFSELKAAYILSELLPENIVIHIANSMPVRLFNLLGCVKPGTEVLSNRGTSGIDGCTSTAIGFSCINGSLNVLITGDLAFFYDRNALWNDYINPNFRVIILNNHGGGIFGLIDGPAALPELAEYFETNQPLNAKNTAADFGLDYYYCKEEENLKNSFTEFMAQTGKAKILEIETNKKVNKKVFDQIKSHFI